MRVVIVGPAPPLRGGIAKHTLGLQHALTISGHAVEVISYTRLYPRFGFPGRSEKDDGPELGVAALDTLDPRSWHRTQRLIHSAAPDLIIVQWWHPVAAPALAKVVAATRAPVAAVCHNICPHEPFAGSRALARFLLKRVDFVVCHSRSVTRELERLAPRLAQASTPMPFLLIPPSELPSRRRCDGGPAALFLGYLRTYKGLDVLLEAWRKADLPAHSTLTIAGESYLGRGRLARLTAGPFRREVRVVDRYLHDREVWSQLARAQVMVLPYRSASQSGVLPLALLAGLRAIVSDVGGLAEAVAGDPGHHVVPPGDAVALARSLEAALWAVDQAGSSSDATQHVGRRDGSAVVNASWQPTVRLLERVADGRTA